MPFPRNHRSSLIEARGMERCHLQHIQDWKFNEPHPIEITTRYIEEPPCSNLGQKTFQFISKHHCRLQRRPLTRQALVGIDSWVDPEPQFSIVNACKFFGAWPMRASDDTNFCTCAPITCGSKTASHSRFDSRYQRTPSVITQDLPCFLKLACHTPPASTYQS
jgi:hypothetical protein